MSLSPIYRDRSSSNIYSFRLINHLSIWMTSEETKTCQQCSSLSITPYHKNLQYLIDISLSWCKRLVPLNHQTEADNSKWIMVITVRIKVAPTSIRIMKVIWTFKCGHLILNSNCNKELHKSYLNLEKAQINLHLFQTRHKLQPLITRDIAISCPK